MNKTKDAMNDTFRIQLKIADKNYPLICKRNDEKIFRSAANLINDKLISYGNKYQGAPIEKNDLTIMAACDIAASQLRLLDQQNETPAYDKIARLNAELESFIEKELQHGS